MEMKRNNHRIAQASSRAVFAAIAIAMLSGCSQGLPMVPVRGTITFSGQECPSDGSITFKPIEIAEGLPNRAGTAQFQKDGQFRVTSFSKGDGLMPGRYVVEINCISGLPDFTKPNAMERVSYIAPGYQPDELVVEKGNPLDLTYDVPLKKGRK